MSEIWAKSAKKEGEKPVLLSEHIRDILKVFENLGLVVNEEILKKAIKTAIVCHDFGKAFPAFQIKTLKNNNYLPYYIYNNLPHSLLSLLLINQEKLKEQFRNYLPFIVSAIVYHHWRDEFIELIQESEEFAQLIDGLGTSIYDIEKNLKNEIKKIGGEWEEFVKFQANLSEGLKNDVPFYKYAIPPYQLYWFPKRLELDEKKFKDWIFIAGFLQRCDHFASYCEEEGIEERPEIEGIEAGRIKHRIKDEIKKKIKSNDLGETQIWQINKINELGDGNLILIAPTGYGKTEFAFLWSNGEKFFYTLPLRSAVNQIYNRAKEIFNENNEEKVGLLHSDADVFLLGDGGEAQVNFRSYDLARQLAFPVIVSTGDQFFPYALKPPGYEKIYATFSYSRLVIDEVQAYNPDSVAIIVKFIEDTFRMGGKFLLMTATLPSFVKKEIYERVGENNFKEKNLYEDERQKFEQIKKHRIKIILIENNKKDNKPDFTLPDDQMFQLLDIAKRGKRVLVITNTVKQAQNIFEKLKDKIEKVWLLHSQFTLEDRINRESILVKKEFSNPKPLNENEGKILVATQVVEASLDIDADILFTEIAPLDALVQRMGRVLRRYGPTAEEIPTLSEPNIYVWVYKNGLSSGQNIYDKDLLLLTLKILKEPQIENDQLKKWIINKNEDFLENNINNFEITISEFSKYELVKRLYEALPEDHSYLKKFNKTLDILEAGYMSDRKEEAQKIFRKIHNFSIVPYKEKERFISEIIKFFNTHQDRFTYFKQNVLSKFVVSVPIKQISHLKFNRIENWFYEQKELDPYIEKLRRWCSGIYYSKEYDYDSTLGARQEYSYSSADEFIL